MLQCSNGHSSVGNGVRISSNSLTMRSGRNVVVSADHSPLSDDAGLDVTSSFCKEVVGVNGLVQQMILKFSENSSPNIRNGSFISTVYRIHNNSV
jgi:hypothetical protein